STCRLSCAHLTKVEGTLCPSGSAATQTVGRRKRPSSWASTFYTNVAGTAEPLRSIGRDLTGSGVRRRAEAPRFGPSRPGGIVDERAYVVLVARSSRQPFALRRTAFAAMT